MNENPSTAAKPLMIDPSPRRWEPVPYHPRRMVAIGVAIFILLAMSILIRYTSPRLLSDLHPWPDTVEYVVGAVNILEHGRFFVNVNDNQLPSRYSFGFPLLIVPFLWLFGAQYENAIFAVLFSSVLEVAVVYWLVHRLVGHLPAFLSSAVIVSSQLDVVMSRLIMSDLPATTFAVLSMAPLVLLSERPNDSPNHWLRWLNPRNLACLCCSGGTLGFSIWIRQSNIALVPAFVVFILLSSHWSGPPGWPRIRRSVSALLAFSLTLVGMQAAILVYNLRTFGSLFRTGYNYWLPTLFDHLDLVFGWDYAFGSRNQAWSYLLALAGFPQIEALGVLLRPPMPVASMYPTAVAAIAFVGLVAPIGCYLVSSRSVQGFGRLGWCGEATKSVGMPMSLLTRFRILIACMIGIVFLMQAPFAFFDLRFIHICVPLIAILFGIGISDISCVTDHLVHKNRRLCVLVGVTTAFVIICSFAPTFPPLVQQSYLWQSRIRGADLERSYDYERLKLVSTTTAPNAVVVANFEPQVFSARNKETDRSLVRLTGRSVLPPGVIVPTLAEDLVAIRAAIRGNGEVYYVGQPEDFEAAAAGLGLQLRAVAFTRVGDSDLSLYEISLAP